MDHFSGPLGNAKALTDTQAGTIPAPMGTKKDRKAGGVGTKRGELNPLFLVRKDSGNPSAFSPSTRTGRSGAFVIHRPGDTLAPLPPGTRLADQAEVFP